MSAYADLSRAQLHYEYLHTNSTTHEFLFGALAELVDNSRDAGASRMDIFTIPDKKVNGGHLLCFQDDGEGMTPTDVSNVISFGCSIKKGLDSKLIGQYGNGLKSGSMRIAKDMILFTKKELTMTCLMISRSFHEDEKLNEVVVPLPSFYVRNHAPLIEASQREKHDLEMGVILKYSPFHTRQELFSQFKRLTGDSGTLVVLYNLKLLDSGETELDFKTDPHDILLTESDQYAEKMPIQQRHSFRSYVSMLYLEPRMKVFIQEKKVQLIKFVHELYKPRCYQYSSARFKARSKDELKKAEDAAKAIAMKAKEAEGKARKIEKQFLAQTQNKEGRMQLRLAQKEAELLQEESKFKHALVEKKRRELKDPKTLNFIFGINLEHRHMDGLFIYNCCRLIKMNEKIGSSFDNIKLRGIVGIVDIPYIVLEPTHNKQDFADAKEYRHLLRALSEHYEQYWRDIGIGLSSHELKSFWEGFGYLSQDWEDPPSNDLKYLRKRAMQKSICLQCDACLKWRVLPFSSSHLNVNFPDNWVCSMNSDTAHNRCSAAEEKIHISEGKLQKIEKSKVEKEKTIVHKIKKLKGELEQIQDNEKEVRYMPKSKPQKSYNRTISERSRSVREIASPPVRNSEKRTIRRPVSVAETFVDDDDDVDAQESDGGETSLLEESEGEMPKKLRSDSNGSRDSQYKKRKHLPERKRSSLDEERYESSVDSPKSQSGLAKKIARLEPQVAGKQRNQTQNPTSENNTKDSEWEPFPEDNDDEPVQYEEKYALGTKIEIRVKNKWYLATIIKVKPSGDAEVKFDKFPDAKYNKKVHLSSPDVKLLTIIPQRGPPSQPILPAVSLPDPSSEMPSSSTSAIGNQNLEHLMDDVCRGYRTCLHYFLPPQWTMDKDTINSLSSQELGTFPLDDFFDNYEKGLKQLVSTFQTDALLRRKDAQKAEANLKNTTRLIVRLLNIIHEECNLDPDKDRDKVDDVLLACVQQAEEAARNSSKASRSKM